MPFHIDFESRSAADLKKVGAYRYAEDDSTVIFMMAISKDDGPTHLWVNPIFRNALRGNPEADDLLDQLVNSDETIYAHSVQFERAMLMFRGAKDLGLKVPIKQERFRCTAAMARKAGLPDSLDMIGSTLGLSIQKDKAGKDLIKFFCEPNKDGMFNEPAQFPKEFAAFGKYCCTDTDVEKLVQQELRHFELRGSSLKTFLFDIRLNDRGIPVNVGACRNAKKIIDEVLVDRGKEFFKLTSLKPTQRAKVKDLIDTLGWPLANMQQEELQVQEEALEEAAILNPKLEKALDILRRYMELNYAAAKKVHTILDCVNKDGRVRGTLLYYGAGTGRWSGRSIQPQNFKKPSPHHRKNTDGIYDMICAGASREGLELVYGNPLDAIASSVRHFIQCNLDADFASIEARIVCWLAGQEDALQDFRNGVDQYIKMAGAIYDRPVASISNPSPERDLGKQAVLGCGFQMAGPKFKKTCAKYKIIISDELAKKTVAIYRAKFYKVVKLWYAAEDAARAAINSPGKIFTAGKLAFCVRKLGNIAYLCMTLPSKRVIVYPRPRLELTKDSFNGKPTIYFFGNIKGRIWGDCKLYGGLIIENADQATAADFMSEGACNAEEQGFEILTLVHDQGLAFGRQGRPLKDEAKAFGAALEKPLEWAVGCPIVAEAKECKYYKK